MKRLLLACWFAFPTVAVLAQGTGSIDSLKVALSLSKPDTNQVNRYQIIAWHYTYSYPDTALAYAAPGLVLARKLRFKQGEIRLLHTLGEAYNTKGNYTKALEIKLQALSEAEQLQDPLLIGYAYNYLGALYTNTGDYQTSLLYYSKVKAYQQTFKILQKFILSQIGRCYLNLNRLDSADWYCRQSYELDLKDQTHWSIAYYNMGDIEARKGHYVRALDLYRAGIRVVRVGGLDVLNGCRRMAAVFHQTGRQDSALYYAKTTIEQGLPRSHFLSMLDASRILTAIYQSRQATDSAFKYQQILLAAKDTMFSQEKVKLTLNLSFKEQQRRQQLEQQRKETQQQYETKVKLYSLVAGLAFLSLLALLLYRNNRHKQHTNALLQQKNQAIQRALTDLKATQTQLIQQEKMASLGELTAGIAHEIQNPLNFVNNFAEVSEELVEELRQGPIQELKTAAKDEAEAILSDLAHNLSKIHHHGQRADSIVKGMLQHSRSSTGEKQPTDLNALAEECLRLSYHGLRAKDPDFKAELITDLAIDLDKVAVVPQEIGRVLLNVFNNAFYATQQKKSQLNGQYHPEVKVSTRKVGDQVEIRIRDNGEGIVETVKQKIYQPFFTTKPTGEGTGLGLSLSYDIVTKGHGGELKVESQPGQGAEFVVTLPFQP